MIRLLPASLKLHEVVAEAGTAAEWLNDFATASYVGALAGIVFELAFVIGPLLMKGH